jgi:hypothetical protein
MNDPSLLRRHAAWGIALGVMMACGTQDNTPPSSYGYPYDDAGSTVGVNNAANPGSSSGAVADNSASSSSSGGTPAGGGNSSGGGSSPGSGSCPSSCSSNADCASCPLPNAAGKNCCVMGICATMSACPTIRDSGRDGS